MKQTCSWLEGDRTGYRLHVMGAGWLQVTELSRTGNKRPLALRLSNCSGYFKTVANTGFPGNPQQLAPI